MRNNYRMTDQQLMEALSRGREGAAEAFVARFDRRVFRFLLGWLGDPDEALDLTQEVLVRVCRSARTYNGQASLLAWVFRIARNLLIDRRRKRNFQVIQNRADLEPTKETLEAQRISSPEVSALRGEVRHRVREAIDALPPRQKLIVQLRLLGDLSLDESLKRFEEGIKLAQRCERALTQAEKKIEILTKKAGGEIEAQPFGEEEDEEVEESESDNDEGGDTLF